jgi:DNA-binding transcriptional regulator YdaS (Cro superfamily)
MTTPILKAIEVLGGQAAMARTLRVHPALVSQWATGRRPVAARHILAIEAAAGVSRHVLRPDVFGEGEAAEGRQVTSSGATKRALRARLGLSTDKQLAKVLQLPVEQVSGWADEDIVPALPEVMKLLGHTGQQEPTKPANDDPDADRIAPIEVA